MQQQTNPAAQRKSQGSRASTSQPQESEKAEMKPVTSLITDNLGDDAKQQIEEVVDQASQYIKTGRSYVSENRGEALALAVAVGAVGWALVYTKLGRQILEAAAPKSSRRYPI